LCYTVSGPWSFLLLAFVMVMLYITRFEVAMALNCAKNILRYPA